MKLMDKYAIAVAFISAFLISGCAKDSATYRGEEQNVLLQMSVGTRAVDETDGTPNAAESDIHTLRVYAFVDGELAGHFYTADASSLDPGTDGNGKRFLMDLKMYSLGSRAVDFYVVANESAMETLGTTAALTENTSRQELEDYSFTELETANGLPMYCKKTETINFDEDDENNPQTAPGHEDHILLKQKLTFELSRPVGKLGIFVAKPAGESGDLTVTGISMINSRFVNYLMPQLDKDKFGIVGSPVTRPLKVVEGNVAKEFPEGSDRKDVANYTAVLGEACYPFENPWGSDTWNTLGDPRGNVVLISYRFSGGEERTGTVYMPVIVRNTYYQLCCLISNSGKITVEYTVADWDDEDPYSLDFAHPTYSNPLMPSGGSDIPSDPPTIYYNSDHESELGSFSLNFNITAPVGQEWQPTMLNATQADYEITVWQHGQQVIPPYYPSSEAYTIKIRALKAENVGKKVDFAIAYTPKWDPSRSSLLLINGLKGDTKWPGSDNPYVIAVEQVDHI